MKSITQTAKQPSSSRAMIIRLNPDQSVQLRSTVPMRLACATASGIHLLELHTINYCVADGNYVRVNYGDDQDLLLSKTLGSIAERLPKEQFFRAHQSYVINLHAVTRLDKDSVQLNNEVKISVSRRYRNELKARIMQNTL